ncbi:MAG: DUF5333 domain-containing protein [Pseudomonadota bacterium]
MKLGLTAAVVFTCLCTPALTKPHLRDVASINDPLVMLEVANRIRRNCTTISVRMVKAIGFVQSIQSRAKAMGYTQAEIDAYVDSDADKARLRARATRFLNAQGVRGGNPQSYCTLGKSQIERSTQIGVLLRME